MRKNLIIISMGGCLFYGIGVICLLASSWIREASIQIIFSALIFIVIGAILLAGVNVLFATRGIHFYRMLKQRGIRIKFLDLFQSRREYRRDAFVIILGIFLPFFLYLLGPWLFVLPGYFIIQSHFPSSPAAPLIMQEKRVLASQLTVVIYFILSMGTPLYAVIRKEIPEILSYFEQEIDK